MARGREGLLDEPAQPGVGRRVARQHRAALVGAGRADDPLEAFVTGRIAALDARRRTAQQTADVVVAGEDPRAEVAPVDRLDRAQRCIARIRVLEEAGPEQREPKGAHLGGLAR